MPQGFSANMSNHQNFFLKRRIILKKHISKNASLVQCDECWQQYKVTEIITSLLLRPYLVWISLHATPIAKRVSNHAIKAAAAAAARLSVRQIRKWCDPAKVEAKPTILATSTKIRKIDVAVLPANIRKQKVNRRVRKRFQPSKEHNLIKHNVSNEHLPPMKPQRADKTTQTTHSCLSPGPAI